jgi:SAM-dependent methyltransferase
MYEFHKDKQAYFKQQVENAASYVIPFVEQHMKIESGVDILEVGCAEAGVLKAFLDKGCKGVGVELSESRAELAKQFLTDYIAQGKAEIISKNIYDEDFKTRFAGKFDLIVLKDVIEHIPDQQRIIIALKHYLKPGGKIFFGFPPWQMPFGGHQQVAKNKWLSKLPYYHLLPMPLYRALLKRLGESDATIQDLTEVKETGISIEQFERYVSNAGMKVLAKTHYLVNPIYKYKFGLKPRKQIALVQSLPYLRNFFTTCVYYLVG